MRVWGCWFAARCPPVVALPTMFMLARLPRALALIAAFSLPLALGCDGDSQPPKSEDSKADSKVLAGAENGDKAASGEAANGSETPTKPSGETRTPMIAKDHPLYSRMEGTNVNNACAADNECFKGGCGNEICAATKDTMSTCERFEPQPPASAQCGCIRGECIWYTTDGATMPKAETKPGQGLGDRTAGGAVDGAGPIVCGDKTCASGEQCIEYFGIAGPRGPRFQTCAIPCGAKRSCPKGLSCVTVADGPGDVCQ